MKKVSGILAMGLALSLMLGMTAFAQTSPLPGSGESNAYFDSVGDIDTKTEGVDIDWTPVDEGDIAKVESSVNNTVTAAVNNGKLSLPGNLELDGSKPVNILGAVQAEVNALPKGGADLTFAVSGVSSDKTYAFLHYFNGVGGDYEILVATVGNGTLTAHFKSLSPIFIIEIPVKAGDDDGDNGNNGDNGNAPAAGTGAKTSPKTGESIPVATVIAVIGLAGAAVCAKKVRYNK